MQNPSPLQLEAIRIVADGRFIPALVREEDGWYARWTAVDGEDNPWIDEFVRSAAITPLSADAEDQRHETIHDAWMMALRSRTGLVRFPDDECARFAAELAEWSGAAAPDVAARKSVVFRLVPPKDADGRFALECETPKGRRALRALGQATYVYGPIRAMRAFSGRGGTQLLSTELTHGEAESFMRTGARDLCNAGYGVEGCDITAEVTAEADLASDEDSGASEKNADSPSLGARLVVKVDGEAVSAEEIRFLLEQGSSLVFFRNRWIEVDRSILREALRALERGGKDKLSQASAVAFALGIGSFGKLEVEEAKTGGWLRGLVGRLKSAGKLGSAIEPGELPGFSGELRDYQRRGVAWMKFLTDNGFGALLADDMGLGKTVQTIAWLVARAAQRNAGAGEDGESRAPALIVAPLTLLANWRHELADFAPSMRLYVHQGDGRRVASGFRLAAAESDIVLTSYTLLVKDHMLFAETEWDSLVLDEAQAIKNPDTQVAAAVKKLGVRRRMALSGTPVENTAADIWSIEEFLNPGFLPDRRSFADRFVKPLALDPLGTAAKRLRHALEPFVLRRLKSDPAIAAELGDKREIREYCELTHAERGSYEAALADYKEGEKRQGDVFALITRLKLICDGVDDFANGSKLARLSELVADIFAAGESVLVFTQYARVGAMLNDTLSKKFARRVSFLHGGLSAKQREEEIAKFNGRGARVFVLSLRAGGYGLNLVKATHVVHFDRWWNPAVESQATDRAHRIGQSATVFVHKFISSGTLEERVDRILEKKLATAGNLVTTGEGFLASLSPDEFERSVTLE